MLPAVKCRLRIAFRYAMTEMVSLEALSATHVVYGPVAWTIEGAGDNAGSDAVTHVRVAPASDDVRSIVVAYIAAYKDQLGPTVALEDVDVVLNGVVQDLSNLLPLACFDMCDGIEGVLHVSRVLLPVEKSGSLFSTNGRQRYRLDVNPQSHFSEAPIIGCVRRHLAGTRERTPTPRPTAAPACPAYAFSQLVGSLRLDKVHL